MKRKLSMCGSIPTPLPIFFFFAEILFWGCTQSLLRHMVSFQVAISYLCFAKVICQGTSRHLLGLRLNVNSLVVTSLSRGDDPHGAYSLSQHPFGFLFFTGLIFSQLSLYFLHTIASPIIAKLSCAKNCARPLAIWYGHRTQTTFTLRGRGSKAHTHYHSRILKCRAPGREHLLSLFIPGKLNSLTTETKCKICLCQGLAV